MSENMVENQNENQNEDSIQIESICRMNNWSIECENQLNAQINKELTASIAYHQLYSFFNRDNIGYKNIANYFNKCSLEEREHANQLMEYQNLRGGIVDLDIIKPVDKNLFKVFNNTPDKSSLLLGFEFALWLEQDVYQSLLLLHKTADLSDDPAFCDLIESDFLKEQLEAQNELATFISQLTNIGKDGYGLFAFDKSFENK